jgi:4-oxalocrotonate tautomerase
LRAGSAGTAPDAAENCLRTIRRSDEAHLRSASGLLRHQDASRVAPLCEQGASIIRQDFRAEITYFQGRYPRCVIDCATRHEWRREVPEVYVHAVEGRTAEQKKALMKDITEAVMKNFNVPAESVVVTIMEARKTEKMKGGKLFTER